MPLLEDAEGVSSRDYLDILIFVIYNGRKDTVVSAISTNSKNTMGFWGGPWVQLKDIAEDGSGEAKFNHCDFWAFITFRPGPYP